MTAPVDYSDIQGIVRFAYKHLTEACYLLLRIRNARTAGAWLENAQVATAVEATPPPSSAVHIAFSAPGLRALGVPEEIISGFSTEFVSGLSGTGDRSRRLGDAGANAPENWGWGSRGHEPHVLVALFALPDGLDALRRSVQSGTWDDAFETLACLDTSDLGGVEQFGFVDGISQPEIDWQRTRTLSGDKNTYGNLVALGEFLLGYPNEYACYTERPLVAPGGVNDTLAAAEDEPAMRDIGRNGTYLVMRDLRQDVRAFWQFVYERAGDASFDPPAFAARFVGRALNGDPLVPVAQTQIEGISASPQAAQNNFTFTTDPNGVSCPFGAHVRRANPRTADYPSPPSGPIATLFQMLGFRKSAFHDDLLSSARFHRIVRRGREYGPKLSATDAQTQAPPGDALRGLRFLCINANIERQFEFLQNAWIASNTFNGLTSQSDPLLGNRRRAPGDEATDTLTIARDNRARTQIAGLPPFVTVTGGAYFFLPSVRVLRYFARIAQEQSP